MSGEAKDPATLSVGVGSISLQSETQGSAEDTSEVTCTSSPRTSDVSVNVKPDDTPVKKIVIDDSDDDSDESSEVYVQNMGLPYSDHNYDVPDPSKRYKKEDHEQDFPTLAGLSELGLISEDSYVPIEQLTAVNRVPLPPASAHVSSGHTYDQRELHILNRTPTARDGAVYRSIDAGQNTGSSAFIVGGRTIGRTTSQVPAGFRAIRSDMVSPQVTPQFMSGGYGISSVGRRTATVGQTHVGIPAQAKRGRPVGPTLPGRQLGQKVGIVENCSRIPTSTTLGSPQQTHSVVPVTSKLHAPRQADPPPHRAMQDCPPHRTIVNAPEHPPHRIMLQQGRPVYSSADPSQAALANAPAPLIVSSRGSKPLVRGRGGSQAGRSKKDDISTHSDDGGLSASPAYSSQRSISASPRKQVIYLSGLILFIISSLTYITTKLQLFEVHFLDSVVTSHSHQIVPDIQTSSSPLRIVNTQSSPTYRTVSPPKSPPKSIITTPVTTPPVITTSVTNQHRIDQCTRVTTSSPPHTPVINSLSSTEGLPDNFIEEPIEDVRVAAVSSKKSLKESSLPPEVAAAAVSLSASSQAEMQPQWASNEISEEDIKAKIEAISREIAQEMEQKRLENEAKEKRRSSEMVNRQRRTGSESEKAVSSGEETPAPVPRGRGRPKGSGRMRSSLSNSSGNGLPASFGSPAGMPMRESSSVSPTKGMMGLSRPVGRPPIKQSNATIQVLLNKNISATLMQLYNSNLEILGRFIFILSIVTYSRENNITDYDANGTHTEENEIEDISTDSSSEDSENNEVGEADDDWGEYVTRCHCEMQHNDEFMVQCDKCSVWQHVKCMGLDHRKLHDDYLCEQCKPRRLKWTKEQAQDFQVYPFRFRFYNNFNGLIFRGFAEERSMYIDLRCCRPNTTLKHILLNGKIYVMLVASEHIDKGSEITIPFDCDFRETSTPLECACSSSDDKDCPLVPFNMALMKGKGLEKVISLTNPSSPLLSPNGSTFKPIEKSKSDSRGRPKGTKKEKVVDENTPKKKVILPNVGWYHIILTKSKINLQGTPGRKPKKVEIKLRTYSERNRRLDEVDDFKEDYNKSDEDSIGTLESDTESSPKIENRKPDETNKKKRSQSPLKKKISKAPTFKSEADDLKKDSKNENESLIKNKNQENSSTPRSPKKEKEEVKEQMDYTLPEDRNKPSREERKLQAMLAAIEKREEMEKKKGDKSEKKDDKSKRGPGRPSISASTGQSESRRGRKPSERNVALTDKNLKDKVVRESPRGKKKSKLLLCYSYFFNIIMINLTEEDGEDIPEITSTSTSTQPPRKRWAAALANQEQHISPRPSSPIISTPAGGKKQWLRRHAAESVSEENKEEPPPQSFEAIKTEMSPPLKKRRIVLETHSQSDDERRDEAAFALTQMGRSHPCGKYFTSSKLILVLVCFITEIDIGLDVRTEMKRAAETVVARLGGNPVDFQLYDSAFSHFIPPVTVHSEQPTGAASQVDAVAAPSDDVSIPRKVKRISIEDYKKRRNTGVSGITSDTASTSDDTFRSPGRRDRSFMPSMDSVQENITLPHPHHLGDDTMSPISSPPLNDLKKSILDTECILPPPPPPPPRLQSPRGGDTSTDEEGSEPRMSLAERLAKEFGIGMSGMYLYSGKFCAVEVMYRVNIVFRITLANLWL
uniref:PHD domain-containing protein n=1 Tax=Heterorhabditis bacteriophora TaxID=37862 RepID=A0A1I7WN16_HETBA